MEGDVLVITVIFVVGLVVVGALARLGAFSPPHHAALPEPEPALLPAFKVDDGLQWCLEHVIEPLNRRTGVEWRHELVDASISKLKFKRLLLSCPSRDWSLAIVFNAAWRPVSWSCLGSRGPRFALCGINNRVDWQQQRPVHLEPHHSLALMSLGLANVGARDAPQKELLLKVKEQPVGSCRLWCGASDRAATLAWLAMESRRASLHKLISGVEDEVQVALLTFSRGPELSVLLASGESLEQELSWLLSGVARWTSELERIKQWQPLTEREQTLPLVMDCFEDRRHVELRWVTIWQIATSERLASLRPMLKGKIMNDKDEPWQALLFGALVKDDSVYRRERYMEHYRRAWADARYDDEPDEVVLCIDSWWFALLGESLVELVSWEQLWAGCLWRAKMLGRWEPAALTRLYACLEVRISRQPRFEVEALNNVTQLLAALGVMPAHNGQLLLGWLKRLDRQANEDQLWRSPHRLKAPPHELPYDEVDRDALYKAHQVLLAVVVKRCGERAMELWAAWPDHELGHRLLEAAAAAGEGEALMTLQTLKGGVSRGARKRAEGAIKMIQDRLGQQHGELTISTSREGGELTQIAAAQGAVTVVGGRDE